MSEAATQESLAQPKVDPGPKTAREMQAEAEAPATMGAQAEAKEPVTEEVPKTEEEETELEAKAETEDETEEEAEADGKPKRKGGFQRQLAKKDRKISDLEREREYWREQALRTQSTQTKPEDAKKLETTGKPDPKTFESNEDYLEALTEWKVEQRLQKVEAQAKETKLKSEAQTRWEAHSSRIEKFKESHPDLDLEDALDNVKGIQISLAVNDRIVNSKYGPEIMYELANNPKEFARICKLPAMDAAEEIGFIAAKFAKTDSPPKETKKTVPRPITPVRGKGAAIPKDLSDPNLSMAEYNRIRDEQEREQRRNNLRR